MNQAELLKQIRLAYQNAEKKNDTAAMQTLENLYEAYSNYKDNLVAAVSKDADLFRSVGLDTNKDISKMIETKPEEIVKQYSLLKDPTVLENIDSWSLDKWRAMAKANGFSNLKEFINLLYDAKASYDQQKAWQSEVDKLYLPGYGRVNADNVITRNLGRGQDWAARTFYRNTYEAGKRLPTGIPSSKKEKEKEEEDSIAKEFAKELATDQLLNVAAIASPLAAGKFGAPLAQAALGAGIAGANEAAGVYLSDADFDLKQLPLGALFGAFGGRAVGKTGGDIIKSGAGRIGLKPKSDKAGKIMFGIGDTLEDAAIDPVREAEILGKTAKNWLQKNVDAKSLNDIISYNVNIKDKKAAIDKVIAEANDAPAEVMNWLKAAKDKIDAAPIKDSWKAFNIDYDKNFWRRSIKNDLPTKANVDEKMKQYWLAENGPDLEKYMIVDGQITSRIPGRPYRSPTKEEFEEWVKTIPENEIYRSSWADDDVNDIVRIALKAGSQGYGTNRARKDADLKAEVEGIRKRKPEDYEKYVKGEASNLTYAEKIKIDELMKKGEADE